MAVVSLVGLPAVGTMIYLFDGRMRKLSQVRQELMGGITAHQEESVSGQRIVEAFDMECYERARFRLLNQTMLADNLHSAKVRAISISSIDMIAGFVVSAVPPLREAIGFKNEQFRYWEGFPDRLKGINLTIFTIQNVDPIMVMHDGRIVEKRTHADLLALGREYARFHLLQFHERESACLPMS